MLEDEGYNLEKRKMKLFSYIVTHDAGFAPNPFWGHCTLACCKPKIRKTASIGDWIVGLSPKGKGHKIIYAMQVAETLSFEDYYRDKRFAAKIPINYSKGKTKKECGDNIYVPVSNRKFLQLPSHHSNKQKPQIENIKAKKHDLSVNRVLISKKFHYFGRQAIGLPPGLRVLKVARGHKNRFSRSVIEKFQKYIAKYRKGRHAFPTGWDKGGHSCQTENRCGSS
jgi:hypothetical protein